MGATKPLLQLGDGSVLQRVATAFRTAGVRDLVVVTGHDRDRVAAEAAQLGLREAHNQDYEMGMFTSVQAGARSLTTGLEAFVILPVDCPLVEPRVVSALLADLPREDEVIYPTCCGRRGHPPLISGSLLAPLRAAHPNGNLRDFLLEHATGERNAEVEDLSILLDMDTPRDFQRLTMFAAAIDARRREAATEEPRLSPDDAAHLLASLEVEERVIRHCAAVARVAATLAEALNTVGANLDVPLVGSAGLLHDMAKGERRHASIAQNLLTKLGFPELGEVVGAHMVLPNEDSPGPTITERDLVYLADKLVVEDVPGSIETRAQYALKTYGHDDQSVTFIKKRMRTARAIALRIETELGRPLDEVLASPAPISDSACGSLRGPA
jgi:probable phosphoglycerate mutase